VRLDITSDTTDSEIEDFLLGTYKAWEFTETDMDGNGQ
jgi:hypothetical protein